MARGDPPQSPWSWSAGDYVGLTIGITLYFDNVTRLLADTGPGGVCVMVHRDSGCQYHKMVFDIPSLGAAPRLPAPNDGKPDAGYTLAQVQAVTRFQPGYPNGWQTFEDSKSVQITAES